MTDKPKFTPAPWKLDCAYTSWANDSQWNKRWPVARALTDSGFPREEHKANAHLIAAAPELYDVLERLAFYHGPGTCPDDIFEDMNRVLKKARGEDV